MRAIVELLVLKQRLSKVNRTVGEISDDRVSYYFYNRFFQTDWKKCEQE